jgi:hypothetical protein
MSRTCAVALAALSGCAVFRVHDRPGRGPRGELVLKAVREEHPRKLAEGYGFHVIPRGRPPIERVSRAESPIVLSDLPPGRYRIEVEGKGIDRESVRVKVRPGRRIVVLFFAPNAKALRHWRAAAETAGKILLYAVLNAGYFLFRAVLGLDDDERCGHCRCSPCSCPGRQGESPRWKTR